MFNILIYKIKENKRNFPENKRNFPENKRNLHTTFHTKLINLFS